MLSYKTGEKRCDANKSSRPKIIIITMMECVHLGYHCSLPQKSCHSEDGP